MICSKCGTFIQVSETDIGSMARCEKCGNEQEITRTEVLCACPECKQNFNLEAWCEGELFTCPVCGKSVRIAAEHKAAAPTVPHFRSGNNVKKQAVENSVPVQSSPSSSLIPPDPVLENQADQLMHRITAPVQKPVQERPPETFIYKHRKRLVQSGLIAVALLVLLIFVMICFSGGRKAEKKYLLKAYDLAQNGEVEDLGFFLRKFQKEELVQIQESALKGAIENKQTAVLKMLFDSPGFPENHPCFTMAAVPKGRFLLKAMKESRRGLNTPLKDHTTLLEKQLYQDNLEYMEYMLKIGADPNVVCAADGLPLVFHAVRKPNHLFLLLKYGAHVNVSNWQGNTLLLYALSENCMESVPMIIQKMRSVSHQNKEGRTALHILLTRRNVPLKTLRLLLNRPCAVNANDPAGNPPLKIALKNSVSEQISLNIKASSNKFRMGLNQRSYAIISMLLGSGAKRYSGIDEDIKKLLYREEIGRLLKRYDKNPVEEIADSPEKSYVISPLVSIPGFHKSCFPTIIFIALYTICSLLSVRLAVPLMQKWRHAETLNLLLLFSGFFGLTVIVILRWSAKVINPIKEKYNALMKKLENEEAVLIDRNGKECARLSDPEMLSNLVLARGIFTKMLQSNSSSMVLLPLGGKYSIQLKNGHTEQELLKLDLQTGRKFIKLCKILSGLNAVEEQKPQDGFFSVSLAKNKNRINLSTVGLGSSGERAVFTLAEGKVEITQFSQLMFAEDDQTILHNFIQQGKGLVLVSGPVGTGRRTLVSLLLEELCKVHKQAAWIGDGSEPAGSDLIPRLKTDPTSGITTAQLLTALSDYPVFALTIGKDTSSLKTAIELSSRKAVILLMDVPLREALKHCREAGGGLFASSFRLALRPWLCQKLCACAVPAEVPARLKSVYTFLGLPSMTVRKAAGCPKCVQTGMIGNIVLYETAHTPENPAARPAWNSALLMAFKLASAGLIPLADLEKIEKGE